MRTIVFATQKGGCGKSTLAACLAVAAHAAGERVFILDMDPKKSLSRWGSKRNDSHLPVRAVSPAKLLATLSVLSERDVSLVVLDTPALESPATLTAIKAADLLIVPVRPAPFDIWASEVTGRKLKLMAGNLSFFLTNARLPTKPRVCKMASLRSKPLALFYVPTSGRVRFFWTPRGRARASPKSIPKARQRGKCANFGWPSSADCR
jgi:cellulose biosynthesis protein BcsQ